ncbi:MAG: NAD-dependent epimerase/dehydratase family protein [Vicinamibacterales bacterium]|jgi:UDP-glucose 4-epimerase|nr:NAD-dependent epimerase/dehydratase family protein [Vicinamibacterales bacterium]
MSRVLVTGGAGFVGSHVADALIRRGHDVTVLDDLSGGFREHVPGGARFVPGDVADATLVDALFAASAFDHVFHLAAYAAEGLSHFIRRFNYSNNVLGSVTLLNASVNHGVRTFVFTSSIAVYGASPVLPVTEEVRPAPEDPYGIAKYAVELDLRSAHDLFGLDFVVFRPHNIYGPRQNIADPYRNVVGIFMNQLLQGRPMTIFGEGTQTRAFSYIDDVAPVIAEAIDVPGARNQVFNVGSDEPVSLNDLCGRVAAAMGTARTVVHLAPRREVAHIHAAHGKLRRVFGDRPETPLADGLAAMAGWARAWGARAGTPFEHLEIERHLPESWRRG